MTLACVSSSHLKDPSHTHRHQRYPGFAVRAAGFRHGHPQFRSPGTSELVSDENEVYRRKMAV
jgi:hypothetical protein